MEMTLLFFGHFTEVEVGKGEAELGIGRSG